MLIFWALVIFIAKQTVSWASLGEATTAGNKYYDNCIVAMSNNYSVAQHKKKKAPPINRMSYKDASECINDCIVHLKVQSARDKKNRRSKTELSTIIQKNQREVECVFQSESD